MYLSVGRCAITRSFHGEALSVAAVSGPVYRDHSADCRVLTTPLSLDLRGSPAERVEDSLPPLTRRSVESFAPLSYPVPCNMIRHLRTRIQ